MKDKGLLDIGAYLKIRFLLWKRPLDINIETYAFCPMKCVFCCNRKFDRKRSLMSVELFEKIVREYCVIFGGGAVGIGAMQSDFLSDPLLLERIKILKRYKKYLYVYSTTPLISCGKYTDEELTEILRVFDYLEISVEGHDEESYRRMSGINGFHMLEKQLERVERLSRENHINCYLKFGFRTYDKKALVSSGFYRKIITRHRKDTDIKDKFFDWFGSIKKEDLIDGSKLIIKDNTKERENCAVPYATLAVQANGKVVGCGCIDWLEKYVIGDCRKERLDLIWRSRKARRFRNAFRRGELPGICRKCGLYISETAAFAKKELIDYKPMDGVYYNIRER